MAKPNHRPQPRFENGKFVPAVPIPDPRATEDYRWYHGFSTLGKIANNPLETFNAAQFRDPYTQYKLIGNEFLVINSPDLIHHCFVTNRQNYKFSEVRQRILRAVIGDGLISAEGEKWQHARRAMSPMFTPRNVKTFATMMKKTTQREMHKVLEAVADTNGELEIANPMAALTYLVLSDTLFSGDLDRSRDEILSNVSTALLYMGRPDPIDFFGAPDWVPRLTRLRGLKAVKSLRAMIAELIQIRKGRQDRGEDLPDDFLSRLLKVGDAETRKFTDTEIEDHLLAFIGAGHETTARALSWMFYLLANDTKARDRLEAEVDALDIDTVPPEEWGDRLPFAQACFEETMRLFPPAPFIIRKAVADDTFDLSGDKVTIQKNTILMLNTWQLHRHETLWEHPAAFVPERFLGNVRTSMDRFQYLPFGVGERVCIGQRFAMQEAMILVALLARRYRFEYAGNVVPWPKLRITIQPENNMPMRIIRR